jgi:hypothetical protein
MIYSCGKVQVFFYLFAFGDKQILVMVNKV